MNPKSLFLATFLGLCLLASLRAEPFNISSIESPFSIAIKARGNVQIRPRSIVVRVAEGEILRQPWGSSPKRRILSVCAFLAMWNAEKTSYQMIVKSDILTLGKVITVGESVSFNNKSFKFDTSDRKDLDLSQAWLGFVVAGESMEGESGGSVGTCYAHETTYLLGGESGFPPPRK